MSDDKSPGGKALFPPGSLPPVVYHFVAHGEASLTASAMAVASVYFDDMAEREDWTRLPIELAKLDLTHLRMLSELKEPIAPKLRMLTGWAPTVVSDQVVKLAATSVLNEKLASRERSHARTLQWIAAGGLLIGGLLGYALAIWMQ